MRRRKKARIVPYWLLALIIAGLSMLLVAGGLGITLWMSNGIATAVFGEDRYEQMKQDRDERHRLYYQDRKIGY